jgi:hypothetical protein
VGGGWLGHRTDVWRSATASLTARHGIHAGLQAADGDDLVPRPDSDGEGTGSPAQDSKGGHCRGVGEGGTMPPWRSQTKEA